MLGWAAEDVALGEVSKANLDGPLGEAAFELAKDEVPSGQLNRSLVTIFWS